MNAANPAAIERASMRLNAVLADLEDAGQTTPCRDLDRRDWWTSDDAEEREAAAFMCQPCPAIAACAQYGDAAGEKFHVFGGIDRAPQPKRKATP